MLTPDGHTVAEAAHIMPWSESHDDKPSNGLSLCRLCHWSFDEGLMSVGVKYEVLVSKRVQTEHNLPGHILTLRDRPIFTPALLAGPGQFGSPQYEAILGINIKRPKGGTSAVSSKQTRSKQHLVKARQGRKDQIATAAGKKI
jgi:hypothetical protein